MGARTDIYTRQADDLIAQQQRDAIRDFMGNNMPMLRDQANGLGGSSIVDDAATFNSQRNTSSLGARNRNLARFGGSMSPNQRAALERSRLQDNMAANSGNVNIARRAQTDHNNMVASGLAGIGNSLTGLGLSGLGEASALGHNRARANAQARFAANQANLGVIGSIGSMALGAFGPIGG